MREDRGAGIDPVLMVALSLLLVFIFVNLLAALGEPQAVWLLGLFQ